MTFLRQLHLWRSRPTCFIGTYLSRGKRRSPKEAHCKNKKRDIVREVINKREFYCLLRQRNVKETARGDREGVNCDTARAGAHCAAGGCGGWSAKY